MNNFIISLDDTVEGADFELSVADLFENVGIPLAEEYAVNWYDSNFDITIDSIEADGVTVWHEATIELTDWNENDDKIVEGLIGYIENNIYD